MTYTPKLRRCWQALALVVVACTLLGDAIRDVYHGETGDGKRET